jgi:hypothetical protein
MNTIVFRYAAITAIPGSTIPPPFRDDEGTADSPHGTGRSGGSDMSVTGKTGR